MMGNSFTVSGWTLGDPHSITGVLGWYYKDLYRGESLIAALWCALRARRSYGCVKVEMR